MLEIGIGIVAGIISGLGMGGGTILILALILLMNIEQHVAQASNLLFFIPTSIVATVINAKKRRIDWKVGIPIALSGTLGAIIGAKFAIQIESTNLRKYFGILYAKIKKKEIKKLIKMYILEQKTNNKNKSK